MAADRRFAAAGAQRARTWAEWFAPTGRQIVPGRVVAGREEIREFMAPFFASADASLEWTPDQGGGADGRGWTSGRYVSRTGGEIATGRYLTVWVRESGRWLVDVDTGIPDPPAAVPAD